MKVALVYSTKNGSTEKLVRLIGKRLIEDEVSYINLHENASPKLDDFECVIVGGPVYFGSIQPQTKQFCDRYERSLLGKKLVLFTAGILSDQSEPQFEKAFSPKLRDHSSVSICFNGIVNFERLNFFERLMVWKVAASKYDFHTDTHGITNFIMKYRHAFGKIAMV